MKKAIFLDRDGTINVEKNYLYRIEDFEFLNGSIEALKMFQHSGFKLIVITNQSGIGRGLYTEEDFLKLSDWMTQHLHQEGISIDEIYYCPHHPDAKIKRYQIDCDCRKPKLGLYKKAIEKFNLDLSKSFAIGDKLRDCEICNKTNCEGFLIAENEDIETIRRVKNGEYTNIHYAASLIECARIICSSDTTKEKKL